MFSYDYMETVMSALLFSDLSFRTQCLLVSILREKHLSVKEEDEKVYFVLGGGNRVFVDKSSVPPPDDFYWQDAFQELMALELLGESKQGGYELSADGVMLAEYGGGFPTVIEIEPSIRPEPCIIRTSVPTTYDIKSTCGFDMSGEMAANNELRLHSNRFWITIKLYVQDFSSLTICD